MIFILSICTLYGEEENTRFQRIDYYVTQCVDTADDYFRDQQFDKALYFYKQAQSFFVSDSLYSNLTKMRIDLGIIYCESILLDEYSIKNELEKYLSQNFFDFR